MRKIPLKIFRIFILLLVVVSCQNSDDSEMILDQQSIKTRKLNFSQIPHLSSVKATIDDIRNQVVKRGGENTSKSNLDGLVIYTDEVILTEYEDTHTYTFKMTRSFPETYIENIVLKYNQETELYDEYFVRYNITTNQFLEVIESGVFSSTRRVHMTTLEDGLFESSLVERVGSCFTTCQTIFVPCDGSDRHEFGNTSCPLLGGDRQAYSYQSCGITCFNDPSDPDNDDTELDGGPSTGGGIGQPVITNPNPGSPCESASGVGIIGSNGGCINIDQINIDTSLQETCAEDIINDFRLEDFAEEVEDVEIAGLINTVFNALAGDGILDITYKAGNIAGNGLTTQPQFNSVSGKFESDIILSNDLIANGTKLAIAKTIFHESIHAYILYVQQTDAINFNNPAGDYATRLIAYAQYQNSAYADHVYMATLIKEIGRQLEKYATEFMNYPNQDLFNNAYAPYSKSFYFEAVAWSGTAQIRDPENSSVPINNPLFELAYPNPAIQQNIINIFNAENMGTTTNEQSPIIDNNCN